MDRVRHAADHDPQPKRQRRVLEPGPRAPRDVSAGPRELLALQRTAGNRAVQRALAGATAPLGVQRFSVDAPDFSATKKARRTTSGAEGAILLWDSSPDGLVVKATGDPMPESVIATMFQAKLTGSKDGIGAPKLRPASTSERGEIAKVVETKIENWAQVAKLEQDYPAKRLEQRSFVAKLKKDAAAKYATGAPGVQIMGMAKGKEFKHIAKDDPSKLVGHLLDPGYMERLGFASAVDYFLGNQDRLNPNVANLGNWMSEDGVTGTIALIDNMDVRGFQKLKQESIGPGLKMSDYQSEWGTKGVDLREKKARKQRLAGMAKADKAGNAAEWDRQYDAWIRVQAKTPMGWLADPENTAVRSVRRLLDILDGKYGVQTFERGKDEEIKMAEAFLRGLKDGRKTILSKMAPQLGQRSRSLKTGVMAAGGGQEAWDVLKSRARLLRELT